MSNDVKLLIQICDQYVVSTTRVKQKAIEHKLSSKDKDLTYLAIIDKAYEESPEEEKKIINQLFYENVITNQFGGILVDPYNFKLSQTPIFIASLKRYRYAL